MMGKAATTCEYCNSAQSMLLGNVYCSRHNPSMRKLENGTILIKAKNLESVEHTSRLSIRYNFSGEQYYQVGSHHHLIRPDRYLIINQNQSYKTAVQGNDEKEMFIIGFKPDFAEHLLYNLTTPADKLLDDPENVHAQPVNFFEQTYTLEPEMLQVLQNLRQKMNKPEAALLDFDSIYGFLLEQLLQEHRNIYKQVEQMKPVKQATRVELFKRVSIARDYMDAFAGKKMNIQDIAAEAALSPYHFQRLFKQVFRQTPHQYLTEQRLKKAVSLLLCTSQAVSDICQQVGFDDAASFSKLFRKHYGMPPNAFRLKQL
ncbi:MAG: helix-turn-helix transcriptional regulator [Hymenobacteraceae bacterium]|nr:helix-turn-helix transcriptional regulator [Hymenobacteraceae bacterium]